MTDQGKASKGRLLTRKDLQHDYSWEATGGDNPRLVGFPDDVLLSRTEGYEVLPFINRFAERYKLEQKVYGHKTEWLIRENLPTSIRSHEKVRKWLVDNWKTFDGEWDKKVSRGDIVR